MTEAVEKLINERDGLALDYKMNLVEARKNNLKLHNINNKDLFNLFLEFFF